MQYQEQIVKAMLLNEKFDERSQITDALLPLFESVNAPMTKKLSVAILLATESKNRSLVEMLEYVKKNFVNVMSIIEEHDVKLPEEECALEATVKKIYEEGEAPANVTANIDATTPRIDPKKKKDESDT
jgi:hypothetical protein